MTFPIYYGNIIQMFQTTKHSGSFESPSNQDHLNPKPSIQDHSGFHIAKSFSTIPPKLNPSCQDSPHPNSSPIFFLQELTAHHLRIHVFGGILRVQRLQRIQIKGETHWGILLQIDVFQLGGCKVIAWVFGGKSWVCVIRDFIKNYPDLMGFKMGWEQTCETEMDLASGKQT